MALAIKENTAQKPVKLLRLKYIGTEKGTEVCSSSSRTSNTFTSCLSPIPWKARLTLFDCLRNSLDSSHWLLRNWTGHSRKHQSSHETSLTVRRKYFIRLDQRKGKYPKIPYGSLGNPPQRTDDLFLYHLLYGFVAVVVVVVAVGFFSFWPILYMPFNFNFIFISCLSSIIRKGTVCYIVFLNVLLKY